MKGDKILYVVDSGQSLHFRQILYLAEKANWKSNDKSIEHINFGIVKGVDGKRIKSRSGNTPKLNDLLEQAVEETEKTLSSHYQDSKEKINFTKEEIENLAYGSIKYADLSITRKNDKFQRQYVNIYIMYSYLRCKSIVNKVSDIIKNFNDDQKVNLIKDLDLTTEDCKLLQITFRFPEVIEMTEETKCPHHICSYIFELSDIVCSLYSQTRCVIMKEINY